MESSLKDLIVLEDHQSIPFDLQEPPRSPKWYDTLTYIANPDQFCQQNLDKYGAIFKTRVFGGTTVFLGSAPEIQMAFNGDYGGYTEIGLPATTMEMFGEYSLFQRPDLHRSRKSSLSPAFTGQMLEGYLPRIRQVIADSLEQWEQQSTVYLFPSVEKICFDILAPLLLGINLDNPQQLKSLPVDSKEEVKQLYKVFFDGFYGLLRWRSSLTSFGRGMKAREKLIELMRQVIKQQKAEEIFKDNSSDSFLSMMLFKQDQEGTEIFKDAFIENQSLLQLWASHYEVSGLISSWIYQMSQYPEIGQKLRQEYTQLSDENLSLESLKKWVTLDATIKETLRLLPPSSTANRRLTKTVILNGILYKKGWVLIAEPRIAHQRSEYFHDPQHFNPNRFLGENSEAKPYQFIPFGGGIHACLGAQLAMAIAKVFAIELLQRFDWKPIGEATFIQFPLRKIKDNYQIELISLS